MASIKIPVIYTSYPFSVEATEYSLRMEKNRHSLGIATGFTVALLMFAVIGKLGNSIDADEIPSVLGLLFILCPVAGGVISGIYAEKLRKRYFMKKSVKLLRNRCIISKSVILFRRLTAVNR